MFGRFDVSVAEQDMALDQDQLERLADDAYMDRRIGGSVYCERCGYNLRTLPYLYQCPECGQEYNARPLTMKGVYLPFQATVPVLDTLSVVFWAVVGVVLLYTGSRPLNEWLLALGVGSGVLAIIYSHRVWTRFRLVFRAMAIERRIRADEGARD